MPQHIIDLVGDLYDKGMDDESICLAVISSFGEGSGFVKYEKEGVYIPDPGVL